MTAPTQSKGERRESNATIRLQLRELGQLFNSMDPSPFHDRDLDADAEEFIVSWAREYSAERNLELVIHLATAPAPERAEGVETAVRHYFDVRSQMKDREFRLLMRRARISLVIGLVFLAACMGLSELMANFARGTLANVVREGLVIAGWVAMWRPIQNYLYDWWPLREERTALERLARMPVRLVSPPS